MESHPLVEGVSDRVLRSPGTIRSEPPVSLTTAARAAPAELVEAAVLQIERSKIVTGARFGALLDAVVLAAEQVQDVRIGRLENPPAPPAGLLFSGLLLTFFLESTAAGAVAAAFTRSVMGRLVRHHRVFMLAPKSQQGREIAQHARYLAGVKPFEVKLGRRGTLRPTTPQTFLTNRVTRRVERGDVSMYAGWVQALVTGSEAAATNVVAGAKAVAPVALQEAFKADTPPKLPGIDDTPGVALLGAAMTFRSTNRAASDYLHAAAQSFLRTAPSVALSDIEIIATMFDIPDLAEEVAPRGRRRAGVASAKGFDLSALRDEYKLVVEGLIWALLFNFERRGQSGVPTGDNQRFTGIPKDISIYLRERLAEPATTWFRERDASLHPAPDGRIGAVDLGKWLVTVAKEAAVMTRSTR